MKKKAAGKPKETVERRKPVARSAGGHQFYTRALDEAEQIDFELAAGVEGINDEICLLRIKIKSLVEKDPENIKLLINATDALARMLKTRYSITRDQKKGVKEAFGNVLKEIALPIGIGIGTGIGKTRLGA